MPRDTGTRKPPPADPLLNVAALAERLDVSERVALNLMKSPGFPVIRLGSPRTRRVASSALEAWLAAGGSPGEGE